MWYVLLFPILKNSVANIYTAPTIHIHIPHRPPNTISYRPHNLPRHSPSTSPSTKTTIKLHLPSNRRSTDLHVREQQCIRLHQQQETIPGIRSSLRPLKPHNSLLHSQHPRPGRVHHRTRIAKLPTLASYRMHQHPPPHLEHLPRHPRATSRS